MRERRFSLTAKSIGTGPDVEDCVGVILRYPSDTDRSGVSHA